ncbi:F-box protein At5g07610 [Humulus lupulus]|uniref:F-box protein At5g07610 n=1 Tax=Humulus lupulus TaxID=3486 RepID=UPI002B401DE9|nr:F-box protein At5g07610 [Humulus lupulus]
MSFKLRISFPKRPRASRNDNVSHPTTPPSSSYSAEIVGSNDDLLNQILLRLPIKSLLKFKSVSKHWLSLISNPNFSRCRSPFPTAASGLILQASRSWVNNPEFHFVDFDNPCPSPHSSSFAVPFKSLTFVNDPSRIIITQSCNGLLLCSTAGLHSPRKYYFVYNPTTKQYTTLPPLSFRRGTFTWTVRDIVLAFDPSKSPHYKVVCVMQCDNYSDVGDEYRIEIYSSETGPWRPAKAQPSFSGLRPGTIRGVFCNGAVHWVNPWGTSLHFKVDEDQLCQMPYPMHDNVDAVNEDLRYVGESRDHLHAILYGNIVTHHLDVFEMERDCARWVFKFKVDLDEISNIFPEIIPVNICHPGIDYDSSSVLCFVRGELLEDSFLVLRIFGIVFRYDFKTRTFCKLCVNDNHSIWCENYQYIQSLACV